MFISKICQETKEPVFITKNGYNDLVILSNELYESLEKNSEERLDKLLAEKYDRHYADFEEFKRDIIVEIAKAMEEIKEGKGIPMEKFVAEIEEKYHINE